MAKVKSVNFKFVIDQKVITPFGEEGIITMMAYGDSGILYYVKSKLSSDWYKENELRAEQ